MFITRYKDLKLRIEPNVYKPDEDSFLIADNMRVWKGEDVLELGTGSGLLSILAAKEGGNVVATDIVDEALECAERNSMRAGVDDRIDFRKGDMFEPVEGQKFDLVLFNPPYLPVSSEERMGIDLEKAWDGGKDGRKWIDEFLEKVPGHLREDGRFIFVQSSLSGIEQTLKKLEEMGARFETIKKKLSFERLYFLRAEL